MLAGSEQFQQHRSPPLSNLVVGEIGRRPSSVFTVFLTQVRPIHQ